MHEASEEPPEGVPVLRMACHLMPHRTSGDELILSAQDPPTHSQQHEERHYQKDRQDDHQQDDLGRDHP